MATIKRIKRALLLGLPAFFLGFASLASWAASFEIGGNHRFGTSLFSNLDLHPGKPLDTGNTNSYLEHRLLLRPDVLIDDHFTIKTEWNLLQLAPHSAAATTTPDQFGSPLDSRAGTRNGSQYFEVRRAWLRWASDWGLFRFGRMPKHWGLGILYDAGDHPLDDWASTADRASFQALIGSLELTFAYEKVEENHLNNDNDDVDLYEGSIEYGSPEEMMNVGILYSRVLRSAASFEVASNLNKSSHNLSLFVKKRWNKFYVGSEFALISFDKDPDVVGWLGKMEYTPGNWILDMDLAYSNKNQNKRFLFHPNYQPFLILFRQGVGSTLNARENRIGGPVGSGLGQLSDGGGAYLGKLGIGYGFSGKKHILGTDVGYVRLEERGANKSATLGLEWDMRFMQQWYENFHTSYALGALFPGDAYETPNRMGWGVQVRGFLEF